MLPCGEIDLRLAPKPRCCTGDVAMTARAYWLRPSALGPLRPIGDVDATLRCRSSRSPGTVAMALVPEEGVPEDSTATETEDVAEPNPVIVCRGGKSVGGPVVVTAAAGIFCVRVPVLGICFFTFGMVKFCCWISVVPAPSDNLTWVAVSASLAGLRLFT